MLAALPHAHTAGLYSCLDYYQSVSEPFGRAALARYNKPSPVRTNSPAAARARASIAASMLWEAAVKEPARLEQSAVVRALDHAASPKAPADRRRCSRPAPCGHAYDIGRAKGGASRSSDLGIVEPKECVRQAGDASLANIGANWVSAIDQETAREVADENAEIVRRSYGR